MEPAEVLLKKDSPSADTQQKALLTGRLCLAQEVVVQSKETVKNYG